MEDSFYHLLGIYDSLPLPIRNAIGFIYRKIPLRIRYGSFYKAYLDRINTFKAAADSPEQLNRLVSKLVLENVNRAIADIPFYQKYEKLTTLSDLRKLPIVFKKDYLRNKDEFLNPNYRNAALPCNTGGSSGTPLAFFLEKNISRPKEACHYNWFWGHSGFVPGARILMVRGKPLRNNALLEIQTIKNCLNISCYQLNSGNVKEILEAIRKFKPEFVHGYPSALYNLMVCAKHDREAFRSLRGVFGASEFLDGQQQRMMEDFFGVPIIMCYGHSEGASLGGNQAGSTDYYFFPFYGYTELLDDEGNEITTPGESGRIVVTGFDNRVMPFIRYDTEDRGTLKGITRYDGIPGLTLSSIDGRVQDMIYLSDHTAVSVTAFIFGQHLPAFAKMREIQLQQNHVGQLCFRYVADEVFDKDLDDLIQRLGSSVGGKLDITLERVEMIPKTQRGKHRFLIQNVKKQQ